MKSRLGILLLLLLGLSLDATVLAKAPRCCKALSHDGVDRVAQRRKPRRPRKKSAQKAKPKVYGIEVAPGEAGGAPNTGASPPPPAEAPSSPAPRKQSAPRIKPPTVMIKPPTE